jgi:hypothetical protein
MKIASKSRLRWPQWSLRSLLLLFIPLCAALAWYAYLHRQYTLNFVAHKAMTNKGVTANFAQGLHQATYVFVNANVTDEDLEAFLPAFNGYSLRGLARVKVMRLNGSPVSQEAIQRFRRAVPDCKVEP